VRNLYLGLKFAFSYFSILPVRFKSSDDLASKEVLGAMLFFFPLVGIVLGLLTVGLFQLLETLGWYGAVLSAAAYMVFYGFIHTEAVIDVADALYASHSGKDAYEVIKDPAAGAMGVLWGITVVLLKGAGTVFLLMHHLFAEFIAILTISRMALLVLFYTQRFRSSFLTQLKHALTSAYLWSALLLFTLAGLLTAGMHFIVLLFMGLLLSYLTAVAMERKLGFINGDVIGTTLESTETVLFAAGALLWL